jgi:hypothetical protein
MSTLQQILNRAWMEGKREKKDKLLKVNYFIITGLVKKLVQCFHKNFAI